MGMLANAAARSEMKNRERILAYIREVNPNARIGVLPLPCHIITEVHNGFYVTSSEGCIGFYRCQGYWWGRDVAPAQFLGLHGPESTRWLIGMAASDPPPSPIAPISIGLRGIALGIATNM